MTPKQALEMIDSALAQLKLNRDDHMKLHAAVDLLGQVIEAHSKAAIEIDRLGKQVAAHRANGEAEIAAVAFGES